MQDIALVFLCLGVGVLGMITLFNICRFSIRYYLNKNYSLFSQNNTHRSNGYNHDLEKNYTEGFQIVKGETYIDDISTNRSTELSLGANKVVEALDFTFRGNKSLDNIIEKLSPTKKIPTRAHIRNISEIEGLMKMSRGGVDADQGLMETRRGYEDDNCLESTREKKELKKPVVESYRSEEDSSRESDRINEDKQRDIYKGDIKHLNTNGGSSDEDKDIEMKKHRSDSPKHEIIKNPRIQKRETENHAKSRNSPYKTIEVVV